MGIDASRKKSSRLIPKKVCWLIVSSPADLYDEGQQLKAQNVQECLRMLLERGASVECRDGQGMQPLHWALQFPC